MIALAAWINTFVVWANFVGASCATVTLFTATRHALPRMRPVYASACVLALIYTTAYVWLAFNLERAGDWSNTMRPISMISWWVVWIAPARTGLKWWRGVSE